MVDKTDKILQTLPNFLTKDENSNNYKLIKSFEEDLQTISSNIIKLKQEIQINTATGEYLEDIGGLFNIKRKTDENDTEFRNRILSFWSSRIGGGTISSLKPPIAELLNIETKDITITEPTANVFNIDIDINESITLSSLNQIPDIVSSTKAVGMYNKKLTFSGDEGSFFYNASSYNGSDLI